MKKLIKILVLSLTAVFIHGLFMGEGILSKYSAQQKAVEEYNNSLPGDHSSENSSLFDIHKQAESGINSLRLLPEVSIYGAQDDSFQSVLVKAEAQRKTAIYIRQCRIVNHFSVLTKLIYPFHFFF